MSLTCRPPRAFYCDAIGTHDILRADALEPVRSRYRPVSCRIAACSCNGGDVHVSRNCRPPRAIYCERLMAHDSLLPDALMECFSACLCRYAAKSMCTDRRRINDLPFLFNTTNPQLYPAATIFLALIVVRTRLQLLDAIGQA
jgi:hypothetical protein